MKKHWLKPKGEVVPNQGNGYYPSDIRRLYNIPQNLNGAGQVIGILEFSSGYRLRDAQRFWSMHNIAPPVVEFISVDGTTHSVPPNSQDPEASLDLQWTGAIAPAAKLVVYEADGGNTYSSFSRAMSRTLQYLLNHPLQRPSVVTISYGDAESRFGRKALLEWESLVALLASVGTVVCVASGDDGAYGMHVLTKQKFRHADAPASLPSAVAVGGTSLRPDGTEFAWTYYGPKNGGATGGGFSRFFAKPSYQDSFSWKMRGLPDVSLNADPAYGYQMVFQGQPLVVGGTSVASPVFAAIVALANQNRRLHGLSNFTNLPQWLYQYKGAGFFRDIVKGNNTFRGVRGFLARRGWDACTGYGSIDAAQFIDAAASYPS